jgi:putative endonuclease
MPRTSSGYIAESLAYDYLLSQGLSLIQRNFYSRFGEIDLIMQDKLDLVFVEVKWRQQGFDTAITSITPAKQRKLIKAASYYLVKLGKEVACRFDAVLINRDNECLWLKNIIML